MQILPSGHEPAAPGDPRLGLAPFRGVRYAQHRVSGLAQVTSPPYDVIAHGIEAQLIAADPHNVVRLILPRHDPARRGDAYHDAARTLRRWQDERILVPDPRPALYVYEQAAAAPDEQAGRAEPGSGQAAGGTVLQRGLIGALRLVPPGQGTVRPHEDVVPGPVAGRRQLMEATQANLEPIFLLYNGAPPGAAAAVVQDTARRAGPLAEAVTGDGMRHRLWAVTDPAELAAIALDLAPRRALIADGHHRYAAYLQMQARHRGAGGGPGPWDYGLALLVDAAGYPPRIGAIHRVVPRLAPGTAADLAKAAFNVRALPGGAGRLDDALAELAAASRAGVAFLVAGGTQAYLLTDPDPVQADAAMPPGRSAHWRGLAASVLQELLLARLWGVPDDEQSVQVVPGDADAAVREADEVPGGTAVICAPMSLDDVHAIAARGERVPRKSTSFGPKPRSGLVIRTFAEG